MQRPREILWFERIMIATLALGILNSWLAWPPLAALRGAAFALTVQSLTLLIMLSLTLFVSRRRSSIAKWILIGLAVLGLPMFLEHLTTGQFQGAGLIAFTQLLGQVVAYGLLFTPDSRRWFRRQTIAT
jgi:hypothetical protein